jgi:phosphoglycerate dehydrogenase-like enzyme
MDKVNILVLTRLRLQKGYLDAIAAVDPCISVKDGTERLLDEFRRTGKKGGLMDLFEAETLRLHGQQPTAEEDLDTLLAEADVIFANLIIPDDLAARSPKAKWIHFQGAGMDPYAGTDVFDSDKILTNGRGGMAVPIAEHALMMIMALGKNIPRLMTQKQQKEWQDFVTLELCGKTLGIIGLGAIGSALAKIARGIGMRVIATRRSAQQHESNVSGVDELYPAAELEPLLKESDFVVVAAPLTKETRHMVGESQLKMMKPAACLINVARGPLVDESAVIRALQEGWIAGFGSDVAEVEPLPPESELWTLPNVILSYHLAANADTYTERVSRLFCDNLRRFLDGQPLFNVVDKKNRY